MQKLLIAISTGLGLGYSPVASGTAGSLLGIAIVIPVLSLSLTGQVVVAVVLSLLAIPICGSAENILGKKDDGRIVADEYLTFPICLLGIPVMECPWFLVVAFLVSRVLDIVKPPPAREAQALMGGLGIVMDDVFANIYALVINHLLWRFVVVAFVLQ